MKGFLNFIFFISIISFSHSQNTLYVSANNGLYARVEPSQNALKITKLNYGTKVQVTERTNLNLDVLDGGKKISGQWVRIGAYINRDYIEAYVFDGYLTEEKLKPRYNLKFNDFVLVIEDLPIIIDEFEARLINSDSVKLHIELGATPENKTFYIKPSIHYKRIEVFQSFETSVTVMNEGAHCDLLLWSHFNSSWERLLSKGKNTFETCKYSQDEWGTFIDVKLDELKAEISKQCGGGYVERVKNIKSVRDNPVNISISTIYIKVILTDLKNNKIEKIIAFEIPMGC